MNNGGGGGGGLGGGGGGGLKPPGSSLQAPAPRLSATTATSEISGRKKVTLAPGHSLMDWIRLGRSQGDLSGVGPNKKRLTLADLAVHNRPEDIWMALRGKVYNITPYMHYHPGGVDELMRAAGKDGTELFDEIHNWVNLESMLEKCLVGYLTTSGSISRSPRKLEAPRKSSLEVCLPPPGAAPKLGPTYDWFQKKEQVTVVIYTKWSALTRRLITTEVSKSEVVIHVFVQDYSYFVHFKPQEPVKEVPEVSVSNGKAEIVFKKVEQDKQWSSLGETLILNGEFKRTKTLAPRYRKWTVTSNSPVTHDTVLLRLNAPSGFTMVPPVGYHIHIVADISGMQIGRSYTVVSPSLTDSKSDKAQEQGRAIHLMIKRYPDGTVTPSVTSVKPGDTMMVSNYDGSFDVAVLNKITHLVLFAAGTGFTAFIRLIAYALEDMPNASFPIKLVFYNKEQKDILWRSQLESLCAKNSRFSVAHVLSREPQNSPWVGKRGRVDASHVKEFVPVPSGTCFPYLCICGQWAFNDSVHSIAKLQGLKEENIKIFSS